MSAATPARCVWSHPAASSLFPGLPTPFTWSLLGAAAEQATRAQYAQLGYELPADVPIWRRHAGRVYVNTTVLHQADEALFAPVGRTGRSLSQRLLGRAPQYRWADMVEDAPRRFTATQAWRHSIQTMNWQQATLLQIMEELEPQAEAMLLIYRQLAAGLADTRRHLARWLADWQPNVPESVIQDLTIGLNGTTGAGFRHTYALNQLARTAAAEPAGAAYLKAGDWHDWQQRLPAGAFHQAVTHFLADYGHWAAEPLESASPRWSEAPDRLLLHIADLMTRPQLGPTLSPEQAQQRRNAASRQISQQLGRRQRHQFEPLVGQLQQICTLLAASRDHLVMVMAAARSWALAAAAEATADGRLRDRDDVFLLELEELKQMMTGEWSSAAQVQPIIARRRAERSAWATQDAPEVLEGITQETAA